MADRGLYHPRERNCTHHLGPGAGAGRRSRRTAIQNGLQRLPQPPIRAKFGGPEPVQGGQPSLRPDTGLPLLGCQQGSGWTWNISTLDRYLTAPRDIATGTKMTFPGVKDPKKRADIIAYLATLQ